MAFSGVWKAILDNRIHWLVFVPKRPIETLYATKPRMTGMIMSAECAAISLLSRVMLVAGRRTVLTKVSTVKPINTQRFFWDCGVVLKVAQNPTVARTDPIARK